VLWPALVSTWLVLSLLADLGRRFTSHDARDQTAKGQLVAADADVATDAMSVEPRRVRLDDDAMSTVAAAPSSLTGQSQERRAASRLHL